MHVYVLPVAFFCTTTVALWTPGTPVAVWDNRLAITRSVFGVGFAGVVDFDVLEGALTFGFWGIGFFA
jgi:hypothetical protein